MKPAFLNQLGYISVPLMFGGLAGWFFGSLGFIVVAVPFVVWVALLFHERAKEMAE